MKRAFLEDLGINQDDINKIMTEYGKDVEKLKSDIDVLTSENQTLTKTLSERNTQLESLKENAGDKAALEKQIEELQAANKSDIERLEAENKKIRINAAVEQALIIAKAKNITATKALLSLDNAELADDGTVKGLSEQITALKEAEATGFMFEAPATNNIKGVTPAGAKDDPASLDYQQLYDKAKADGNQSEAIRIKTEAFKADGTVVI